MGTLLLNTMTMEQTLGVGNPLVSNGGGGGGPAAPNGGHVTPVGNGPNGQEVVALGGLPGVDANADNQEVSHNQILQPA